MSLQECSSSPGDLIRGKFIPCPTGPSINAGAFGLAPKVTHASSTANKPLSASVSGSGGAGASSSGSGSSDITLPSDPASFLMSNCIPQIPIPCVGIILGAGLGAVILFKLLR